MTLKGKNILIMMPQNQFCGEELFGILRVLEKTDAKIVVLSRTGKEATGMNREERYTPDGLIPDWNKQSGIVGKYHAVILTGGKGAQKSLWDDPIAHQIAVDHYRAGSIIGAIGAGLITLARASLLTEDTSTPEYPPALAELNKLNISLSPLSVTVSGKIVTGSGGPAASAFAEAIITLLQG